MPAPKWVNPKNITNKFRDYYLRLMLDGGCVQINSDDVVFKSVPIPTEGLSYRKEVFGGILQNQTTKLITYYNETGGKIIEIINTTANVNQLLNQLKTYFEIENDNQALNQIIAFLQDLDSSEVFNVSTWSFKSNIRFLFLNATPLPTTHLYRPVCMELELTYGCFRECTHCAFSACPGYDTSQDMTATEWYAILDDLWNNGVFFLEFTGGDPFHRSDGKDIIQYANDKGFFIQINTEGSAILVGNA